MNLTLTGMPLKATKQLKITAIPNLDARRFMISVGYQENATALIFDVRFNHQGDRRVIILNSMRNGSYSTEKKEKHFLFQEAKEFEITITFNRDEFHVKIPDDYPISFPNCFGDDQYSFIQVFGDINIKSFNIE
ncbi:beta-galactoside-binding lectin-like [Paramormyrops kingsleyae]|uniref:beta-galactoside-binding lectin-like n=1 Tax=Paramormyrops kingsleyae TaxID=1676925 RepID=UPI003B97128C